MSSGGARFNYYGFYVSIGTNGDVHQNISGSTATVVIRDRAFNNFVNFEGNCAGIYHHLFVSNGEQCIVCVQKCNTVISMQCLTLYLCTYSVDCN